MAANIKAVHEENEAIDELKTPENDTTSASHNATLKGSARFEYIRDLADTLQGRIYLARDLETDSTCVVKEAWKRLVHSKLSRSGSRVPEDFLSERSMILDLAANGATASLVRAICAWDEDKCYLYAMEACQGELFDYVNHIHKHKLRVFADTEALKPQQTMTQRTPWMKTIQSMFRQLCEGVHWMHTHGIAHNDLSLENTMIADMETHTVKIIDFGLARKFDADDDDFSITGRVGKAAYMAPEVYAKQTFDARLNDVYCLGIMLFMMLIGAPIYQRPTEQQATFQYMARGKLSEVLTHWKRLRMLTGDALDLLNKILTYEPQRISLAQVLQHPFVTMAEDDEKEQEAAAAAETQTETSAADEQSEEGSIHGLESGDGDDDDDDGRQPEKEDEEEESARGLDDDDDDDDEEVEKEEQEADVVSDAQKELYQTIMHGADLKQCTVCELLLDCWGLKHTYNKLESSGWTQPNDWHQLTQFILVYEIGFEMDETMVLLKCITGYVDYKQSLE